MLDQATQASSTVNKHSAAAVTPIQPSSLSLPITLQISRLINGVPTDFVLQRFSDRTVVLITQSGRIGTYISCSLEDYGVIDGSAKTYQISVLLGKRDDTFAEVCARQMQENIVKFEMGSDNAGGFGASGLVPSLLLGITLEKAQTTECMQELIATVMDLYSRSTGAA